ncbi:MAG: histidine phosphatase family protein [Hyphomicrobium sp.]|nr:histidine phosphatase family protein [Hyphomicrobium sp.]
MLRLALLRHAKSSWAEPGLLDINRPLNARGRAAAPVMGHVLASLKFTPGAILCSPAKRTRETLELIAADVNASAAAVTYDENLYLAEAEELLQHLRALPDKVKCALVVGHNPGLHELAARLAKSGDVAEITRLHGAFPTAAVALFSFPDQTFEALDPKSGHLETFITPKDRA